MKFLYVLVSSDYDFYYEQALVSITSLRHVMPQAAVSLLVDDKTNENMIGKRAVLKKMVDEYKVVCFDESTSSMIRSRHLKTTMRSLIRGDFLYVDVDTVWCEPVNENDFFADVMGVADGHCSFEKYYLHDYVKSEQQKLGMNSDLLYYCNGGVLFMRDSDFAACFCQRWHELWNRCCESGVFIDQLSLNQTIFEMEKNGFAFLKDVYNAQISQTLRFLSSAKIIHYFSTNINGMTGAIIFQKKSFWQEIKKNGSVAADMQKIILEPKTAFDIHTCVLNDDATMMLRSDFGTLVFRNLTSTNYADIRLLKFLRWIDLKIARAYYSILPFVSPVYRLFKKKRRVS